MSFSTLCLQYLEQLVNSLLLAPQTYASIKAIGERPTTWFTRENGLYSEKAHLTLKDQFWYEEFAVAIERYFIIHAESGSVDSFVINRQAYTEDTLPADL